MRILDVVAKDVYVLMEMSLSELEKVKFLLDNAEINYNKDIPEEAEAAEFLHANFYPFLEQTIKQVRENGIG